MQFKTFYDLYCLFEQKWRIFKIAQDLLQYKISLNMQDSVYFSVSNIWLVPHHLTCSGDRTASTPLLIINCTNVSKFLTNKN